jgi:RNA polymerase sigma-70 factor (ECF subfamily)
MMDDAESDDALLDALARAGDARAFDVLYRRYSERLYATAVRLTRDRDSAADLVHDTWVRAVDSLNRFERRSSFRTWITSILINRIREYERSRRRDAAHDRSTDDLDTLPDQSHSAPLDEETLDRLDLEAAIASLPDGFRQVLVLHDVEGFTHEEIAETLGIVPGTSKSQLARARRRLRELLTVGIPEIDA